jgi:peptidoglycan/LPS O-acetylase OafA/YrhL
MPRAPQSAALHLRYIDGLRGLAALYIVCYHCYSVADGPALPVYLAFLGWGHYCVTVFITISGFCLMLPVARGRDRLRAGAADFYKRRVRRILPPYWFALLFSVVVLPLTTAGFHAGSFLTPLFAKDLLAHAFLIHNWLPQFTYSINGPFWSVAAECQIYLFFPLLVLMWRRLGPWKTLAIVFVVAHALLVLTHQMGPANYLFIFTLGMWGAHLAVRRAPMPWLEWVTAASLVTFALVVSRRAVASDLCVGVITAAVMASCAVRARSIPRDLLSLAPLRWVGSFSYSLYLVHLPIQQVVIRCVPWIHPLATLPRLAATFAITTPVVLVGAYLFYKVAEEPFLSRAAKHPNLQDRLPADAAAPARYPALAVQ